MNYTESQVMLDSYKQLIGTSFKNDKISHIIILPAGAGAKEVGQAAIALLRDGVYLPNQHFQEYELFVLFDLQGWLLSQPLKYRRLQYILDNS